MLFQHIDPLNWSNLVASIKPAVKALFSLSLFIIWHLFFALVSPFRYFKLLLLSLWGQIEALFQHSSCYYTWFHYISIHFICFCLIQSLPFFGSPLVFLYSATHASFFIFVTLSLLWVESVQSTPAPYKTSSFYLYPLTSCQPILSLFSPFPQLSFFI